MKDYAKSAIGQVVLHLTKINEEASNADPGTYSHSNSWYDIHTSNIFLSLSHTRAHTYTVWLCLAALCVIDEEDIVGISSG